jgi:putative tributyrin esterase
MFRTFEISDPRFELEGLRWVTVKSPALRQRVDITLFVPRQAVSAKDIPAAILLHGVYGSHWAWALKGGAHRTAARLIEKGRIPPLVLAMPSDGLWGDGSGYLKHSTQNFEQWIVEEVPAAVRHAVPAVTETSPWFISGLSMGGFAALRLGAKYPERFRAVGGHSPMTHFEQHSRFVEEKLESYSCASEDQSVFETMFRNRNRLPPFRFDCGTEDPLLQFSRELSQQMTEAGIVHEYAEFPGGHEWPFWEAHLVEMLMFFARNMKGR